MNPPCHQSADGTTITYSVMVAKGDLLLAEYSRIGGIAFPGSRQVQKEPWTVAVHTLNPARSTNNWDEPLGSFYYTTRYHTDFDPEWPISVDWPAVIHGLRMSFGSSQLKYAAMCQLGRATIERWEVGTSKPFKGDALQLLDLIKGHIRTPIQAGQLLNLAAAAVLPALSRPTGRYQGREIITLLRQNQHDHADLAPALIEALLNARILVALEDSDDRIEDTYLALGARPGALNDAPSWMADWLQPVDRLTSSDRKLVLELVCRLGNRST